MPDADHLNSLMSSDAQTMRLKWAKSPISTFELEAWRRVVRR